MKVLFLAWQDPFLRRWFPVGKLTKLQDGYQFQYTIGADEAAKIANFEPLAGLETLGETYKCSSLFPFFHNRLMPVQRSDSTKYLTWFDFDANPEPLALLARSGGTRATDSYQVFELPEPSPDRKYQNRFFVHGIRHIEGAEVQIMQLAPGDELSLAPEPLNTHDRLAFTVMKDQAKVGYYPRFWNEDLHKLSQLGCSPRVFVVRVNPSSAPIQYRLLCEVVSEWPESFVPFSSRQYQPVEKAPTLKAEAS